MIQFILIDVKYGPLSPRLRYQMVSPELIRVAGECYTQAAVP